MGVQRTPSQQAAAGGGGSSLWVGPELWRWNGADLSQFELAGVQHTANFVVPAGTLGLSVVDLGGAKLGNALRFTATALKGGVVWPVLAAELALPERFVMKVTFAGGTLTAGGTLFGVAYPDLLPDSGAGVQGWGIERSLNSSSLIVRCIANNNLDPQDSMLNGGNLNAAAAARGGITDIVTCWRQAGDNPTQTRVQSIGERRWDGGSVQADGSLPSTLTAAGTTPTPSWNGQNHNRFGLGVWQANNLAASTGAVDFSQFVIYAHPDD